MHERNKEVGPSTNVWYSTTAQVHPTAEQTRLDRPDSKHKLRFSASLRLKEEWCVAEFYSSFHRLSGGDMLFLRMLFIGVGVGTVGYRACRISRYAKS